MNPIDFRSVCFDGSAATQRSQTVVFVERGAAVPRRRVCVVIVTQRRHNVDTELADDIGSFETNSDKHSTHTHTRRSRKVSRARIYHVALYLSSS